MKKQQKFFCPQCGSVNVAVTTKIGTCNETDCGWSDRREVFRVQDGPVDTGNRDWRDPVNLLPNGDETDWEEGQ